MIRADSGSSPRVRARRVLTAGVDIEPSLLCWTWGNRHGGRIAGFRCACKCSLARRWKGTYGYRGTSDYFVCSSDIQILAAWCPEIGPKIVSADQRYRGQNARLVHGLRGTTCPWSSRDAPSCSRVGASGKCCAIPTGKAAALPQRRIAHQAIAGR